MEPLDPELLSLVRAEQSEVAPLPADRERVARSLARRVGVGFGLGVGLVSGSAAGAATAGGSASLLLKVSLSLVVAGAAAALAVPRLMRPEAAPASQSSPARSPTYSLPAAPPRPQASVAAAPTAPEVGPSKASIATGDSKVVASGTAARALPPLADEARLLQQAQGALRDGKPAQALAALAEHQRRYPRGQLALERSAARVAALCALGDGAQARRAADAFLKEHPGSALSAQVRASCGFDSSSR